MSARLEPDAEAILFAAVEIPEPANREAFVRQSCGDDERLLREVQLLVDNHFRAGQFLERPDAPIPAVFNPVTLEQPGAVIDRYRLLDQIGEGGMGVVYLAEQLAPVRRKVALKVIKPGMDTRRVVARFEAERQALALMDHPHIARVLDAGVAPSGRPYFVMELVDGMPVTEYLDQRQAPLAARLELFLDICRAVQHAHVKGIIHRDLKPTNVLVAECDGKALVKVIDFGIAKAVGAERLTEQTLLTGLTELVGTPKYMSPEQLALAAVDVDTRSDVYALGVLLYEMLTGAFPFRDESPSRAGYDRVRQVVQTSEPIRPSARLSTLTPDVLSLLAKNRQVEPGTLRRQLRRELDWIVLKAIEHSPARRYQSASALADDIEAFLRHDPVTARPPTNSYLLAKFARKHGVLLAFCGLAAASLLAGTAISVRQANIARRANRLVGQSLLSEKQARAAATAREAALSRELYAGDMADAWQAWNDGDLQRARKLLRRFSATPDQDDLREFSWHFLNERCSYEPAILGEHDAPILAATLSPNGELLASADRGGGVAIWDVPGRRKLASWNYSDKEVTTAAFSPDGQMLATAGQDGAIHVWSRDDWAELARLHGHTHTVSAVSWSPDGKRLASGARDNSIRIWNVETKREEKRLSDNDDVVRCVAWTPDGRRLAASVGKVVKLWHADGWQPAGDVAIHEQGILALAISSDGRYLASSGYDSCVQIADLDLNQAVARADAMAAVWSLSFSHDGRFLFSGMSVGGPSVWQFHQAARRLDLIRTGMERGSRQRAALPDAKGRLLITATEEDRQIRIWSADAMLGHTFLSFPEDCRGVVAERDWGICAAADGTVTIRRLSDGQLVTSLSGHGQPVVKTALSPRRRFLATFAADGAVLVWDLTTFQLHRRFQFALADAVTEGAVRMAFSRDERLLGVASSSGTVTLWSLPSGSKLRDIYVDAPNGTCLAFAPNSHTIATSVAEVEGTLWDAQQVAKISTFGAGLQLWDLCFSPDGAALYGGAGADGAVGWEVPGGRELFRLSRHRGSVGLLAVSPDGDTLVTIALDNSARLWHLPTARPLFPLIQHSSRLHWVDFASTTKIFVGASLDDDGPVGVFVFDAGDPG